jgi:hypothetical protein
LTPLPSPTSTRGRPELHRARHLPRPAASQGHRGLFPSSCSRRRFKRGGPVGTEAKPFPPPLGVSSSATPACTDSREKAGAPPPRRAVGERAGAPPLRRAGQGRSRGPDRGQGLLHRQGTPCRARRGKTCTSRGQGAGAEAATTGGNHYFAVVHLSTEPATTPPPSRSEQHRGHPISFPSP